MSTINDDTAATISAVTVTDALARIPDLKVENVAHEIMARLADELDIHVADEDRAEALKIIKQELWWMVNRALWALEPVTIIADPEDEDD